MINKLGLRSSSIAAAICCLFLVITMALPCGAEKQYTTRDLNEQLVMAALWMQTSAEYRALCFQAFNLAKMNLDAFLANYKGSKPVAVIVDADETVIDNSSYEAVFYRQRLRVFTRHLGPTGWRRPRPGPYPEPRNSLITPYQKRWRSSTSATGGSKTTKAPEKTWRPSGSHLQTKSIFCSGPNPGTSRNDGTRWPGSMRSPFFMGDNLNDFMNVFSGKSVAGRFAEVDRVREEFGRRFILLPNPTYGAWEGALYNGNWRAGPTEIDRMRKSHLNRWNPDSKN